MTKWDIVYSTANIVQGQSGLNISTIQCPVEMEVINDQAQCMEGRVGCARGCVIG